MYCLSGDRSTASSVPSSASSFKLQCLLRKVRRAPKRGAAGLQPRKSKEPVDLMVLNVLHDLPFSRNEPLNPADDLYIRILKNKIRNVEGLR